MDAGQASTAMEIHPSWSLLWCKKKKFGEDPADLVAASYLYDEEVEVIAEGHSVDGFWGLVDEEFLSLSCPLYTFLVKMGILQANRKLEMVSRHMLGDKDFGRRLLGRVRTLYTYKVIKSLPDWVYTLMPIPMIAR